MIQRAPDDDAPLRTFRAFDPPHRASNGRIELHAIHDHRAAYLAREGEVSGGRGAVQRLASGVLRLIPNPAQRTAHQTSTGWIRFTLRGAPGPCPAVPFHLEHRDGPTWSARFGEPGLIEMAPIR